MAVTLPGNYVFAFSFNPTIRMNSSTTSERAPETPDISPTTSNTDSLTQIHSSHFILPVDILLSVVKIIGLEDEGCAIEVES